MANPNKYRLSNCLIPKMLKPIQTWENVDRGVCCKLCGACDKLSKYQTQHPEFPSLTVYPWKRKKKKNNSQNNLYSGQYREHLNFTSVYCEMKEKSNIKVYKFLFWLNQ